MHETDAEFDVAIVGCGPVGALLANLLGKSGLSVVVLEQEAAVHPLPRAVHFDGEVMRVFQAAGLAESVAAVARGSSKGMHFVNAGGEVLMIRRSTTDPGPQGWASNWYFHQPDLDTVLREGLRRFGNVELRLQQQVSALRDDGRQVVLDTRDLSSGSRSRLSARYAVGCDGSRSLVRETIGATLEDLGLHQPWLVVDVLVDPRSTRARQLPDHSTQHCDPRRPMTRVYVGGARHRWEIMLMPADDAQEMTRPERFWPLVSAVIGPDDAEIERAAVYTFHSLIATGWRRGRLLLAGDSCHQTPPFLGQGMCAGVRDVSNLFWKIDAVIGGAADDTLLDTYESERRPHVREFIELAVRLGAIIQATGHDTVRARDERFRREGTREFDFPQPQLGVGVHQGGSRPIGVIFPQLSLADGRRLDDAVGNRFALVAAPSTVNELDAQVCRSLQQLDIAIVRDSGSETTKWLEEHAVRVVVLRPDRYVFAVARTTGELAAIIGQLRALPGRRALCRPLEPG